MKIVGIDPGLKATGYGFIEYQRSGIKLIETGAIEPKQKDPLPVRLNKIYTILDELLKCYHPEYLVLEKLYAHYLYPTTASILGHVRGVICLLCARQDIQFVEFPVKRIRKSLTGNGNATKLQTQKVVAQSLKISESNLTLDASDAIALALGFVRMNSRAL